MGCASPRKPHAFTLVELLVVIGIIALLVGILLPALAAARRRSNTVVCAAHLREVAHAYACYAADNKDLYPWAQLQYLGTDGAQHVISWDDQLARYLDSHFTDVEQQAAYAPRPVAILTCPEDHTPRSGYVNPTNGAPVYPRSYGVSCWPGKADGYVTFEGVGGQMSTAEPIPWALIAKSLCVKQSWIRMPVQTILAFDCPDKVNSLGGIISYAGRPYDQTVDIVGYANLGKIGCHGKGWNYAFCDGHVELLTPDQTVRPAGSTYASYLGNNYMWTRDPND